MTVSSRAAKNWGKDQQTITTKRQKKKIRGGNQSTLMGQYPSQGEKNTPCQSSKKNGGESATVGFSIKMGGGRKSFAWRKRTQRGNPNNTWLE